MRPLGRGDVGNALKGALRTDRRGRRSHTARAHERSLPWYSFHKRSDFPNSRNPHLVSAVLNDSIPDETPERRTRSREPTRRDVIFSPVESGAGVGHGVVVDISPDGLQLRSRSPQPVGQQIEIEMPPKEDFLGGAPSLVRGEVVHLSPRESGLFAMGLRLLMQFPPEVPLTATEHPDAPPADRPPRMRLPEPRTSPPQKTVLEQPSETLEQEGRPALAGLLLLLALAALFVLLLLQSFTPWGQINRDSHRLLPSGAATSASGDDETINGDCPYLSEAQEHLAEGRADAAVAAFRELLDQRGNSPAEEFAGRVGHAQALLADGQPAMAAAELNLALGSTEGVSEPWQHMAHELRRTLGDNPGPAPHLRLVDALEIEINEINGDSHRLLPSNAEAQTNGDDEAISGDSPHLSQDAPGEASPILPADIIVDTSAYVLTVRRGDEVLGAFPVGLGRGGATPQGTFYVANKIRHPDWFNRGQVVKAGDPANPLGDQWMGLGGPEGPTSYGIHPTNEPESIGKNESRGCIRMRPADAERVFGWCPLGTHVHIHP